MALIVTLCRGGDVFFLTPDTVAHRFALEKIICETHFQLRANSGKIIDVVDDCSVEVLPDVFVASNDRGQMDQARLLITAPQSVRVLRGDLYRKGVRQKCQTQKPPLDSP